VSFTVLALIGAAALLGPALAVSQRWRVPVVIGELVAGILLGPMVFGRVDAGDSTLTFLADVGFAVVMFVAGSHVPLRDGGLRRALPCGLGRAALVGMVSVPVGLGIARLFGTGHGWLYAVLLASSSAALVLPVVDALRLQGQGVLELLPQVAVADAACIVALPLAIDPARAGRSAVGAGAVLVCAAAMFLALRQNERRGWRRRLHHLSEKRKFALELRINLVLLFALAAVAQAGSVSIMLAGFTFGLVVAAIGEPRRLARQLFAVTEGFLGPVFFVWLGASLDLRALGQRPSLVALGVVLGAGAVLTHAVGRLVGQPVALGALAAAQLGVPVAAATLGTRTGLLEGGEPAAIVLGALVTIAVASVAGSAAARRLAGGSSGTDVTRLPPPASSPS
jgi:Kef-type K+ transport system membrane component KefB